MKFLTVAEVGKELKISPRRVRALIGSGKLRAEKIGRDWLIRPPALKAVRVRKPGRPLGWRKGATYRVTRKGGKSWRVPAQSATEAKEKVRGFFARPPLPKEFSARREVKDGKR